MKRNHGRYLSEKLNAREEGQLAWQNHSIDTPEGDKLLIMDAKGCTFPGVVPCNFQQKGRGCLHPSIS